MIEFINSLNLDDNTKKALIGAYSQEKNKFENEKKSLEEDFKKEKDKLQTDFESFKESVKDYDLIKKNLKTSQENEATLSKQNKELIASNKKDKIQFAIKDALNKAGARHTDLIAKDIDASNLDIAEDGSITGLDEAINKSKEQYKDLFGQLPINTQKSADFTRGNVSNISPEDAKTLSVQDWIKIRRRNKK